MDQIQKPAFDQFLFKITFLMDQIQKPAFQISSNNLFDGPDSETGFSNFFE